MICSVPVSDRRMEIQVSTQLLARSRRTIDKLCKGNHGKLPRGAKASLERDVGVGSDLLYLAATCHLTINEAKVSRCFQRDNKTIIVMNR